jgi:DNA-binding PucR family transcriptional regulator
VAQQQPAQTQGQAVVPKAPYDSTKAQLAVAKEENIQLKANAEQLAFQQQMKEFQEQYNSEEASLNAWIESVRKINGWDASYIYDRAKDEWIHTAKAATSTGAKK